MRPVTPVTQLPLEQLDTKDTKAGEYEKGEYQNIAQHRNRIHQEIHKDTNV